LEGWTVAGVWSFLGLLFFAPKGEARPLADEGK
jgi:hypothetical protein